MKKLIVALVVLLSASAVWAARGMVLSIEDAQAYTDAPSPTVIRWTVRVLYQGGDVPDGLMKQSLQVNVTSTTTPAQLSAAVVAKIQSTATENGFTVPVSGTLMPSYTLQ